MMELGLVYNSILVLLYNNILVYSIPTYIFISLYRDIRVLYLMLLNMGVVK